jgi:hypothetical protein
VILRRIRARLAAQPGDAGLGMTEVVAALMIFTVIAVGMAYSLVTMTRLTGDTRNREVAAALASQEIDDVRAVSDAFTVQSQTSTQTVAGTTYTISRTANWVSTTGSTANCGGGGGNLQYKGVQVQVTWPGMAILTNPVQANTDLAPQSRINDPSYGTIIVSVLGADGTGRSGLTVSVAPVAGGGGAAVGTVSPTDASGCTYVLKVVPGTYTVGLSTSGYIDYNQAASPSTTLTVSAGSSVTANFAYDQRATYSTTYASKISGNQPKLPDALVTNFLSSKGNYPVTGKPASVYLYPLSEGYAAVAGTYVSTSSTTSGCLSVDPNNWQAGTVNGQSLSAGARQIVGVAPGATGSIPVPMGVVKVTWPLGATSITASGAAAPAGTGDPGCAQPTTYTFSYAANSIPSAGSTVYLALPYGSWQLAGTIAGVLTILPATGLAAATQGEVTGTTVTLDPRQP